MAPGVADWLRANGHEGVFGTRRSTGHDSHLLQKDVRWRMPSRAWRGSSLSTKMIVYTVRWATSRRATSSMAASRRFSSPTSESWRRLAVGVNIDAVQGSVRPSRRNAILNRPGRRIGQRRSATRAPTRLRKQGSAASLTAAPLPACFLPNDGAKISVVRESRQPGPTCVLRNAINRRRTGALVPLPRNYRLQAISTHEIQHAQT